MALTLPIHTADCERDFSLQNNLKNCQRNRLQAERLDTLMVISAEGPPLEEFPFERAEQINHEEFLSSAGSMPVRTLCRQMQWNVHNNRMELLECDV